MFLENSHQDKENQKKCFTQKRLSLPNELAHLPLKENTNQNVINRNKNRHTDFPFAKDDKYFDEGKQMKVEKMEKIEEEEVFHSKFGSVIEEKQKGKEIQEVFKEENKIENKKDDLSKYTRMNVNLLPQTQVSKYGAKKSSNGENEKKIKVILILFAAMIFIFFMSSLTSKTMYDQNSNTSQNIQGNNENKNENLFSFPTNEIGYKKISHQIYERIKNEIQLYQNVSVKEIEQDLKHRYSGISETLWNLILEHKMEENIIIERTGSNGEKVWSLE